jgi:hypothetical protein
MREAIALAIGFAATLYSGDFGGMTEVVEAETVVADAQPEFRRVDVLETFT